MDFVSWTSGNRFSEESSVLVFWKNLLVGLVGLDQKSEKNGAKLGFGETRCDKQNVRRSLLSGAVCAFFWIPQRRRFNSGRRHFFSTEDSACP